VAIQDAGVGLDPQTLERLFETFYTTKPDGLGMGLPISRSDYRRPWRAPLGNCPGRGRCHLPVYLTNRRGDAS